MKTTLAVLVALFLLAASPAPIVPVAIDTENDTCAFCRMPIWKTNTAAQLVSPGEEPRSFDDLGCLVNYLEEHPKQPPGALVYVVDHHTAAWVPALAALYSRDPRLETPMGSHLLAHADQASRAADPLVAGLPALSARELFAPGPVWDDAIDDYLKREMAARKIPGLGLAITRDGEVIRTASYGLAHVETGSPVTSESIFAIASLDKQVTAVGVLRAAELGKLALEDPVSKWVDFELPGATLRHLLSHLSGLPDEMGATLEGRAFTDYTTAQLLAHARTLTPVAPPGARFLYSDVGLFLAQLGTEKAVGEPWWDFMRREVFARAGMTTPLSMTPSLLLPHRVSAYTLDGDGKLLRDRRLEVDYGPLYSDLGMTVADFARLLAAQDSGRMLARASVATLTTPVRLADNNPASEVFQWSRYGLGVGLDEVLGESVALHSGHSGVGFVRLPDRNLSVVVFTNLEHPQGSDPVGLALGVAGLLEPAVSLADLPAISGADPSLVARLRAAYEDFGTGSPDLSRYAPSLRLPTWEGAPGLAGRLPRLGSLSSFELVRDQALDGARTLLFRARHVDGTIYWRVSLEQEGERISRLVWWHL